MSKVYDLEERTLNFARNVRKFVQQLKQTPLNVDDLRQLLRSSGSIGANYREANETIYWLELINTDHSNVERQRMALLKESKELMHIFGAIVTKTVSKMT